MIALGKGNEVMVSCYYTGLSSDNSVHIQTVLLCEHALFELYN